MLESTWLSICLPRVHGSCHLTNLFRKFRPENQLNKHTEERTKRSHQTIFSNYNSNNTYVTRLREAIKL